MPVFATLFGKLSRRLSPDNVGERLSSHVGVVPNPLSERSKHLKPRIHDAEMYKSVCPYCAVGCGQRVYVKDGKFIDIEGDYDSLLLPLLARLGLKVTRDSTPRAVNIGASLLVLVGGLILRYVWIVAGRASADDPLATHYYNSLKKSARQAPDAR
jgi:hypothetical protein